MPRSVQDPLTSHASNVIGTLNVLLAARDSDVQRVVYASRPRLWRQSGLLQTKSTLAPQPISPYAVAKLAGEGYCQSSTMCTALKRSRCGTSTSLARAKTRSRATPLLSQLHFRTCN